MKTIVRNILNHKTIEHQFSGLAEFAAYGNAPCDMPDEERASLLHHDEPEWDYCAGYGGALAMARGGWPGGAQIMRETADKMYEKIAPRVPVFGNTEHAVSGAAVDIAAYVEGVPECMLEFVESRVDAPKPVDIMISLAFSCDIPADEVCNRGAAILAAVDVLNNRGCAVSIAVNSTITKAAESSGVRYTLSNTFIVHSPGEVMDIDTLAFCLMHPALLRRLCFAAMEHAPGLYRRVLGIKSGRGYGRTADANIPAGTVYFDKFDTPGRFSTPDKAVETVLNVLKQHGLTIADER